MANKPQKLITYLTNLMHTSSFWESVQLQNEQAKTHNDQLLLTEKKVSTLHHLHLQMMM